MVQQVQSGERVARDAAGRPAAVWQVSRPWLMIAGMVALALASLFGISLPLRAAGVEWMRARGAALLVGLVVVAAVTVTSPPTLREYGYRWGAQRIRVFNYLPVGAAVATLVVTAIITSNGRSQVSGLGVADIAIYMAVLVLEVIVAHAWAVIFLALLRPWGARFAAATLAGCLTLVIIYITMTDEEPLSGFIAGLLIGFMVFISAELIIIVGSVVPGMVIAVGVLFSLYLSATIGDMVTGISIALVLMFAYILLLWRQLPTDQAPEPTKATPKRPVRQGPQSFPPEV